MAVIPVQTSGSQMKGPSAYANSEKGFAQKSNLRIHSIDAG
jgi:hypothetical protein